jgi:hypothetical protein
MPWGQVLKREFILQSAIFPVSRLDPGLTPNRSRTPARFRIPPGEIIFEGDVVWRDYAEGFASSRANVTLALHQAPLADFANILFAIAP